MNFNDIKFFAVNTAGLLISISNLEQGLRLMIGLVTLGYGLHKWYLMYEKNKDGK